MSTEVKATISHIEREIRRQPESWRRADELGRTVAGLPQPGERVAVIGCGTSWFMAAAYASLRESLGHGETDPFAASEFPAGRSYDRVVAISRSGTTTEVVRAIEVSAVPVTVITALPDSPVAVAADETILLDFADEESVVQTLFATTALMLLRGGLGLPAEALIAEATGVLNGASALPAGVAEASQITFLGQGWAYGLALEAGLKLREAAQLWTESYLQMEYRHGPIAIAEPGRVVWILGRPVEGICADVRVTGALLVDDDLDPLVDLIRAQLLALQLASRSGLDPDRPRQLTRSVMLVEADRTA
ncbi:fructoselysine-6-P-deglycase FrlB-like protein [Jatrophihabitans sp. GAS493]|uniref:SIS domain-containing protein n=1 Tax=Jatrophihabitans sp. GAS493 TaxID=1907575 RepID=UPI000BBFE433|nr:SIS domain-containing protein [Jatrophihabitans sp. GAS493]SOD74873.1 fructoselysine-6-P-deglycase FrlB-like protein [Jatrophihabitans sp. GAS493]